MSVQPPIPPSAEVVVEEAERLFRASGLPFLFIVDGLDCTYRRASDLAWALGSMQLYSRGILEADQIRPRDAMADDPEDGS